MIIWQVKVKQHSIIMDNILRIEKQVIGQFAQIYFEHNLLIEFFFYNINKSFKLLYHIFLKNI
jgi:hypothetical protein